MNTSLRSPEVQSEGRNSNHKEQLKEDAVQVWKSITKKMQQFGDASWSLA